MAGLDPRLSGSAFHCYRGKVPEMTNTTRVPRGRTRSVGTHVLEGGREDRREAVDDRDKPGQGGLFSGCCKQPISLKPDSRGLDPAIHWRSA